jgi:hypothetical protein
MKSLAAPMLGVSPVAAGQSSRKSGQLSGKSGQLSGRRGLACGTIAGRLRMFLTARHPLKTACSVAAATGLQEAAVAKWLDGRSAPSSPALLVLVGTYGPSVLAAAMANPPQWLDDAAAQQRRAEIEAELDALTRALRGLR